MVPADVAKRVTAELTVPTIGIGAGPECDAQVLVWTDMAGLNRGRVPKFVKRYADLGGVLAGRRGPVRRRGARRGLPGRGALLQLSRVDQPAHCVGGVWGLRGAARRVGRVRLVEDVQAAATIASASMPWQPVDLVERAGLAEPA